MINLHKCIQLIVSYYAHATPGTWLLTMIYALFALFGWQVARDFFRYDYRHSSSPYTYGKALLAMFIGVIWIVVLAFALVSGVLYGLYRLILAISKFRIKVDFRNPPKWM